MFEGSKSLNYCFYYLQASGFDLPIDIEARIQMARARKL